MKIVFFLILFIVINYNNVLSAKESQSSFNRSLSAIKIVSSFTAYNTSSTATEVFGQTTQYRSPTVEAMGSGRAMQMFCKDDYSMVFMSRNIKNSEIKQCQANKSGDLIEVVIGHDSIVFAHNVEAPDLSLTYDDLYKALIAECLHSGRLIPNPHKKWHEINDNLPDINIKIYGPAAGSGTRDTFVNQVIKPKCSIDQNVFNLNKNNNLDEFCQKMRSDEHYIDHGDDYLTLIKKMQMDTNMIGIINFYTLQQNKNKIKSVKINNIEPSEENIVSGLYNLSIPIVIYFKKNHLKNDLKTFVQDITSTKALGKNGYLTKIGINGKKVIDLRELKITS